MGGLPTHIGPGLDGGARSLEAQLEGVKITPMLEQFIAAKRDAPEDALLFFRMGDFYELFLDDAVIAASALSLTLTSRDKGSAKPVAMAGVPFHAAESYLVRLVNQGFSVAICEQLEDPKAAKGIVERGIVRVVTPGTISEEGAFDSATTNYLGAVCPDVGTENRMHCMLLDLMAGRMLHAHVSASECADEIRRHDVRELLLPDEGALAEELGQGVAGCMKRVPFVSAEEAREHYRSRFGREASCDSEAVLAATLVAYAEATQRRTLSHFEAPLAFHREEHLVVDAATQRNLELFRSYEGNAGESLFAILDRTRSALGRRTLKQWMKFPLRDRDPIESRLDRVTALVKAPATRASLQELIAQTRDVERLAGRVALGRATPTDLALLRQTLLALPALGDCAKEAGIDFEPDPCCAELAQHLGRSLVDEPPSHTRNGGVFKTGYHPELDTLIGFSEGAHQALRDLEAREREASGIPLKVKYNKVFGYYLEISKAHLDRVPGHYERKQTLVNAERFITPELKDFEVKLLSADAKRISLEDELFRDLLHEVGARLGGLRRVALRLGALDALASLAQVAADEGYVRPELVRSSELYLEESRHPVVEQMLGPDEPFVPNTLRLGAAHESFMLITGPNMAGKSTLMRQVALSVLMAQMGSYVPAKAARIGLRDRLFTRVGASDNISRGQSTFFVEMSEAATILREATPESLVIVDEIGRGTSSTDGRAIAWAVAEALGTDRAPLCLFATHFHGLTELAAASPCMVNVSLGVRDDAGRVVFLRTLESGPASASYGLQVAAMAGVPDSVVGRAAEILAESPTSEQRRGQLPLLPESAPSEVEKRADRSTAEVRARLEAVEVNATTPMEALALLEELQNLAKTGSRALNKP